MRWIAVKKSEKVWPKKSATAEKKLAKKLAIKLAKKIGDS
jgi:hypothetical protein